MGIKWKSRVKKWMAEALLGAMLLIPGTVSYAEASQTEGVGTEMSGEELPDENLPEGSLAEEELSGPGNHGGGDAMPCGDWVEEKKLVDNQ